jgi:hypothetical protein
MKNGTAEIQRAQKRVAAAGGLHIGDLITWNTDRINVSRVDARQVFDLIGLGGLVPDVDPATMLSRAAGEVRRPDGIVLRPFAQPNKDTPAAFGIYQVKARAGEAGDEYVYGARCRVNLTTGLVVALPPEGVPVVDAALSHAEAVAARANHLLTHCETKDLSHALVDTVKALSGVPLRNKGGFYLLPPTSCPTWVRIEPELERMGVHPITIEMHDAPTNMNVAKSAAASALEADIQELMADLDKAAAEGMRKGALERRVAFCKELKAKAELYRGVLSGITDKIAGKVTTLEQQFQQHLAKAGGEVVFTGADTGSAVVDAGPANTTSPAEGDQPPASDGLFSLQVRDD